MYQILNGKELARKIREELKLKVDKLKENGIVPKLAVILVGDDSASKVYVKNKSKACKDVGVEFEEILLDENTSMERLLEIIEKLNNREDINGILLQSPIPKGINIQEAFEKIHCKKDVDGFNPVNVGKLMIGEDTFISCTPYGIIKMLEAYKNAASESDFVAYMESTAIAQINAQAGTTYTSESDIASQIVTLQSKLDDINVMLMSQASSFADAGVKLTSYKDIPAAISKLSESKTQIAAGIATIESAQTQVADGKTSLDDALVTLNESQISGIMEMSKGYADLAVAANKIEEGQSQLDDAKEQVLYGLGHCHILKISDNEIQWLTGKEDYTDGVNWIRERYNIPLILVSMGKEGSRAYYEDKIVEIKPFLQNNTIETTGAGDTFCGCVLHYICEHGLKDLTEADLTKMLTFANAAAARITTRKGALRVMPDRAEIEKEIVSR